MQLHILTGEYPPQPGGVSDYTALVASALALSGVDVHVWTSSQAEPSYEEAPGVTVHRTAGTWSRADSKRLGEALDSFPKPRTLLVQYTPNVWGHRGLNLGFCRWLKTRRDLGDDVRPMFHEMSYYFDIRDKPTRWIFPVVHRLMLRNVMRASTMAYLSIPGWRKWLRPSWIGQGKPLTWLPVTSTIPTIDDPEAVAEIRRAVSPDGALILGSFGTFHGGIGKTLAETLSKLQSKPRIILMGRGGLEFASRFDPSSQVKATGELSVKDTSLYIQACDLMIQPYPDGISSRRSSAMAGLSHGRPTVTTLGYLSEPIWAESKAVALVPAGDSSALAREVDRLLEDVDARQTFGKAALSLYQERFAIEQLAATLKQSLET